MTKLKTYLKNQKIRQSDFASRIGISQGAVSKIAAGEVCPGLAVATRIEKATGGVVKAISFANPPPGTRPMTAGSQIGHNGGPELVSVTYGPYSPAVAGLSFKKAWALYLERTDRPERVELFAWALCGTRDRGDMIQALRAFSGKTERGVTKWIDGDSYPKNEMLFFQRLMEIYNDDWRAMLVDFDSQVRGKILWGLK